jgi:argininosuccinate lyase
MQRAQPLSLAHHLLAYIEMFQRDRQRLKEVRARVNISPLGAAALAGTKINIDRYFTANELGFENIYKNSIDAVSDRDFCIEFASSSALIMSHLSRISEEIILWVTDEFSFAKLTDRCATGSSLMPQKKNPDVPELIRGKTGRVYGHLHALLTIIKGVPLSYNKDFQEDKEPIFDIVDTISSCLKAMTILLNEGIEFNVEKLNDSVHNDFSNATDLADYLVVKKVPFRQAYQVVGDIVKYCLRKDILFKDLKLEEFQTFHKEFKEDIFENLNPMNVVKSRNSLGGTGFDQVKIELNNWKKKLFT